MNTNIIDDIKVLENIQSAARGLRNKLDIKEARWVKIYDRIKDTPEWKAHCKAVGYCERYSFGDALV